MNRRQEVWPLIVFVLCLIVPVGSVIWAVANGEWGVIEDGTHPFDNAEQVYLPAGENFRHEADLYWLDLGEWPSTEAFYYSPLFAAGMAGLEALLSDSAISVILFLCLLGAYILGTRLWNRELQTVTGIVIAGVVPVFVYYSTESLWANIVPVNVVVGLYAVLALAVWAARQHNAPAAVVALVVMVIAKPQFLFAVLAATALVWNDPGGRSFVRKTILIAVGLFAALVILAAAFSSPAYIGRQFGDWGRFLASASSDYPYVRSDEFFTSNNSLAQQFYRVGAQDLLPLVFVIQAGLLVDFSWRVGRALRGGANWSQHPRQALAFVLWGYLLVGLLAHVFMDLIAGPVVFYFLVSAGLVTSRAMKIFLVAMLTILVVGLLMSYYGVIPCYLIFTIIALPRLRKFAIAAPPDPATVQKQSAYSIEGG
jgi:hypothetical protein